MILSGSAKLAGVLGWPVAHSRSPRLHGFWLHRYGIDGAYLPLPVRPDRFADAVRTLRDLGFRGGNVTLPHKEAAFTVCDRVSRSAQRAGAVNTLIFEADGAIVGDNTDGWGFVESLRSALPDLTFVGRTAVLLGAGGAARAIAAALLDEGAQVALVNRTPERAEALARALGGAIVARAWEALDALLPAADLLINATALGMKGMPSPALPLERLPHRAIVTDIVYVPRRTGLLRAAERRGLRTVCGLGMLLHQARPGFAAWFGIDPVVDAELEAFVSADIPEIDEGE